MITLRSPTLGACLCVRHFVHKKKGAEFPIAISPVGSVKLNMASSSGVARWTPRSEKWTSAVTSCGSTSLGRETAKGAKISASATTLVENRMFASNEYKWY